MMQICSNCSGIEFDTSLQSCPICGGNLVREKLEEPNQRHEDVISISIDFTTLTCDKCGSAAPLSAANAACLECGETLTFDHEHELAEEILDPKVKQRREWLKPVFEMRDHMLHAVSETQKSTRIADEEESRVFILRMLTAIEKQAESLREFFSTASFRTETIQASESGKQLVELRERYQLLLNTILALLSTVPHPTWDIYHEKLTAGAITYLRALLDVLDVIGAEDFREARTIMSSVQQQLDDTGSMFEELSGVVTAGKKLRYGIVADISEALGSLASSDIDMLSIGDTGVAYYRDLLQIKVGEVAPEDSLLLTVMAIVSESLQRPRLLKERTRTLAILFRQADQVGRTSIQGLVSRLRSDIRKATRFLINIGVQYAALDQSQLYTPQKFNLALDAYQRLSEGSFKHLLTFVLFCERLTRGMEPSYDDIALESFGNNVRYGSDSLARSADPLLAGIADDLTMYVRHADAHCDFSVEENKVIVNERDHRPPRRIIATHEYTEDEFAELVLQLFEAVFSILAGFLVFHIEYKSTYTLFEPDVNKLFTDEKVEACKWFLAINGLLVDEFTVSEDDSHITVLAQVIDGIMLNTRRVMPPLVAIATLFLTLNRVTIEIRENLRTIGALVAPAAKFRLQSERGRIGQLRYVELAYLTVSKYADSPELLGIKMSQEEIYCQYFLKWMVMYLFMIFNDLGTAVKMPNSLSRKELTNYSSQLTHIQNLLITYQPPKEHQNPHTLTRNLTLDGIRCVRELNLILRPSSSRKTKELHTAISKLNRLRLRVNQLAQYSLDANRRHNVSL